ncbi:PTS sugar transporter subunit IIA [Enterococcus rivorum]|uniref:PTS mannose transporter subunit IIAB n=1 Tax=Enterococcus rivorum TaxID=762845 RepID=A0A1E5L0V0_9ENTE|nr:fructose PTS transporter subunit IIA [Enterococcus rivorum]MBP2098445.1 PTS system fructose-specific IIA component [Enterococcus rivorum]OEH83701.1 PTS mannose transporter subunit IIAB [Enterococcus rivorum]
MESIDIKEVISQDLIIEELNVETKIEALQALVKLLDAQGYLTDPEEFLKDVLLREEEGVTGLGDGIAIPHGKSDGVNKTVIAIGKNNKGIDWSSLDDELVEVIILFAVKKTDETTLHIKMLQKVAILLANEELLHKLRKATTNLEIYELLTK